MRLGAVLVRAAWSGLAACAMTRAAHAQAAPSAPAGATGQAPDADTGTADDAEPTWVHGDHLTGEWGGARKRLADRGVTIDVVYASDMFAARGDTAVLGHVDAAITLDSGKLGLWDGGTLYVLGQNNHGHGINERVRSAVGVSNLETAPYTQLTELFIEQGFLAGRIKIRIGKQDANRDFGTPRFGGNFINNNFGMFPNAPLPSYPTTGLGTVVVVQPAAWLVGKLGIYEGSPGFGGFGLTSAFDTGGGYTLASGLAATHHFGRDGRDGGTTSVGAWWQFDDVTEVGVDAPRMFDSNAGWFVQNDERIFLHPDDPRDPRGLTLIVRYSWSHPDRSELAHYAGGSAAWHGIGPRDNDTAGIGAGRFSVADPLGGSPGPRDETFVEAFYKLRLTSFVSFQPDLQWFRHPGGDGAEALAIGLRLKVKL
jgi:porin